MAYAKTWNWGGIPRGEGGVGRLSSFLHTYASTQHQLFTPLPPLQKISGTSSNPKYLKFTTPQKYPRFVQDPKCIEMIPKTRPTLIL